MMAVDFSVSGIEIKKGAPRTNSGITGVMSQESMKLVKTLTDLEVGTAAYFPVPGNIDNAAAQIRSRISNNRSRLRNRGFIFAVRRSSMDDGSPAIAVFRKE